MKSWGKWFGERVWVRKHNAFLRYKYPPDRHSPTTLNDRMRRLMADVRRIV